MGFTLLVGILVVEQIEKQSILSVDTESGEVSPWGAPH